MKKTILITGGAGFVGSYLADRLTKENYRVVAIDDLSTGKKENLNSKTKLYKINICNPKIYNIFKRERPDFVFHFAAHINARESVGDPIFDAKNNIIGSLNVLENCKKFRTKKIFFASSGGEIYGQATKIPTSEDYPPKPISPYGIAKLTIEKYLETYYKLFGLPYTALRYGNIYGPRQNPDGEAGVVAIFTKKMLKNKQPFIHGDGRQTKDYIFIKDAIEATILSLKKDFRGVLNIGTGKETSVLKIFYKLKDLTNSDVGEKHVSLPSCSFKKGCLAIRKAKRELNWRPICSLEDGLKKTVEWFKKHEDI